MLRAACVAQAGNGTQADDGQNEKDEGILLTESNLVEAGVVVLFASFEETGTLAFCLEVLCRGQVLDSGIEVLSLGSFCSVFSSLFSHNDFVLVKRIIILRGYSY